MNLSTEDTHLFYRLHGSLLAYANRRLQVLPQGISAEETRQQPMEQVARLRQALHDTPDLLEQFLLANPAGLLPEELAIVAGWRHRVSGDFYIMRYLKSYTVFMSSRETHLYGVLGLYDPLETVTHGAPLPLMVQATLLPFRDRIIYDGMLSFYSLLFGPGIRRSLNEEYNRLKEREGIVEQLVGPDGRPAVRTSLSRRAPRKPAPDWRPALAQIVAGAEKIRQTDTRLQGAAVSLLRAAASLSQAAFQDQGAEAAAAGQLPAVRRALTRLEKMLHRWEGE